MKKYELIKHAYDNYPKGTKVSWPSDIAKIEGTLSGVYHIPEGTNAVVDSEHDIFCLFNGKTWVKKIK